MLVSLAPGSIARIVSVIDMGAQKEKLDFKSRLGVSQHCGKLQQHWTKSAGMAESCVPTLLSQR